jgi:hypothetical protein
MKIISISFAAFALAANMYAGRVSLKWKQKHWSGAEIIHDEARRARRFVVALRWGAGACLLAAAAVWVATGVVQQYQDM